ncbi:hypothetical protein E3N88_13995 [Mikania micrantha]|uniref:RRM domain-containing protein n=1 Tax=Mikania micrantha TaxID=192012 RepID=A0A5N6P397_9ASTR|nr:hypothetical protein E3N88_13995 [Mikania micrantha]
MPPKTVRKVGPGKRGGRTRGASKAAAQPDPEVAPVPEESINLVKVEDPIEVKEEKLLVGAKKAEALKVEKVNEEKVENVEGKPAADNVIDHTKSERLDLEDNDPEESEPEEYVGDDYDEKEVAEDGDVGEEEVEDVDVGEDEDGDMHEGEMEDPAEEMEPEDEDHDHDHEHEHEREHEQAADEHTDMVDADEQEHHDVKVFSAVGEVSEVRLMMNPQTKKNKGFAFLRFATVETSKKSLCRTKKPCDAMDAFKRLQKRNVTFGIDRPAKVSFADSFIDPGDEVMAEVKTVFVDGLPASWDEVRVRDLLKKYGSVEKVELARNMPSAKRKDYGFVTFGTHDAAVTLKSGPDCHGPFKEAKENIHLVGDFRPGRPTPAPFRGSWARPIPRSVPPRQKAHCTLATKVRRPTRPVAALPRAYDRRPPVPSHPKSSLKREYGRREDLPPRSRVVPDGPPRSTSESTYLTETVITPALASTYAGPPRGSSHSSSRRATYTDVGSYFQQGMKDHHQTTVKPALVNMILQFLVQNVHMLPWMTCHLVMPSLKYANRVPIWTMKWEVDPHNMEMHIVRELEDQTWEDMVVAGVQCQARIHTVFIAAAAARACPTVVGTVGVGVVCTHQTMAMITYLVAVMLVEVRTHHHYILVEAWVVVVTWVVVDPGPIIEII